MSLTTEQVAERFEECAWVFDRLPSELRLGFANYWPEITLTPREINRQERKQNFLRPLPDAIDRAEATLRWFQLVDMSARHIVWMRAYRTPWRVIAREVGLSPRTVRRYWERELREVARRNVK